MSISQSIPELWIQRVKAWQESGLSQKAWCDQQDISPSPFSYWKRKQPNVQVHSETPSNPFIPAVVEERLFRGNETMPSIIVTLPNGVTISGIDHHNLPLLKEVMGVLQ